MYVSVSIYIYIIPLSLCLSLLHVSLYPTLYVQCVRSTSGRATSITIRDTSRTSRLDRKRERKREYRDLLSCVVDVDDPITTLLHITADLITVHVITALHLIITTGGGRVTEFTARGTGHRPEFRLATLRSTGIV